VKSYSGFLIDFVLSSFKIRAVRLVMLVPNVRKHGVLTDPCGLCKIVSLSFFFFNLFSIVVCQHGKPEFYVQFTEINMQ
jgi:hypothetical protein